MHSIPWTEYIQYNAFNGLEYIQYNAFNGLEYVQYNAFNGLEYICNTWTYSTNSRRMHWRYWIEHIPDIYSSTLN